MTIQDIRNEQEQVLAYAAERPSELFELLDYIFEHTGTDSGDAEEKSRMKSNAGFGIWESQLQGKRFSSRG